LPTDRPLSIAQVTYTYQPISGGADVYASQLGDLLAAGGHQQVIYQRRAETDAPGVRFIPNPLHGRPLEFWTQGLALFRLWRELRSHDVVVCHYPHYLLAVRLMSLGRRKPVLVGLSHGVFWDDAPRSLRGRLKAWIARMAFRFAHLYVANDTNFLRAMGLRIEPRQHMHAEVAPGVWFIPNGVDLSIFHFTDPAPDLLPPNAVLVPRNLFRNRGVHLAIDAFRVFHAKHPETTLVIVGAVGQADYADGLRTQTAELGLGNRVMFRGPIPHEELPAIYSAAQLTLIPSLCGEGTSLSALESMACGVATVCTYVAGLRDLPSPHAVPLASNVAEVMEEVWPERRQVGEEQRTEVAEHYSIEAWRASWRAALASIGMRHG
jgi:glycosyltransferase involved in cell wall biosynthesis